MKGLKRRRHGVVRDARTIALALEGEESGEEFRYFSRVREHLVNNRRFIVELLPTPADTHQSSPGAVIRRLEAYASENELHPEFDVLWLVFDIDTWPEAMLSDVAQLAAQKRYRLGVSNPCFELWLLLHFDELNPDALDWPRNAKKRSQEAKRLLSEHRQSFGPQDSTLSALRRAVARAEQLVQSTPTGQRWPSFPGTQVHMIFVDLRDARLLPKD